MTFKELYEKLRELFGYKTWSLDVRTMHYLSGTESLSFEVGYSTGVEAHDRWVNIPPAPTAEEAFRRVVETLETGQIKVEDFSEVGEVELPPAPTSPQEIPAAEPAKSAETEQETGMPF